MAASDQFLRNQRTLDMVFALSSIVMLVSIVLMLVQDYNREYKHEQRAFRDVESAMAQRAAIDSIPSSQSIRAAEAKVEKARESKEAQKDELTKLRYRANELRPQREKADARYQAIKADLESNTSLYNIEVDQTGRSDSKGALEYLERMQKLDADLREAAAKRDAIVSELKSVQRQADAIENPLSESLTRLKKLNDTFDTQVILASKKQWGMGDWIRSLPIIDAFNSPIKIQQVTNNDIPIDYNFKHVTRFDRCATCHLGIEKPAYTKENLRGLTKVTDEQQKRLEEARTELETRRKALEGLPEANAVPYPSSLSVNTVREADLNEGRVTEFCAHPRLDLFVGSNSKHPAEKFGCSSCHSGQGSATSFSLAAHAPNDVKQKERWVKEHDWESQHMWDFPMLPQRFVESSCVKCHYDMTDLVSSDNRVEAPKLLRGYNLVKENGCFGCHEIYGIRGGRRVGPDLRLEPDPPLEARTPLERAKMEADTDNPPGTMRKVGPSLYRLVEKTNPEWTARWIRSPRGFRPDTKMPHFYGVSNNDPSALADEQKKFPDTEIWALTHFLFDASQQYVGAIGTKKAEADEKLQQELQAKKDRTRKEDRTLNRLIARGKILEKAAHDARLVDQAEGYEGKAENGRVLFTERGCLACHVHEGTTKTQGSAADRDAYSPAVEGHAVFGPNLSQVAAKLGKQQGDKASARVWLVQWIMNPHVHSPRSRMPETHLDAHQAADVAAWLLSQPATDLGAEWENIHPEQPARADLEKLARVYLTRLMSASDVDLFLKGQAPPEVVNDLGVEEQELADTFSEESLKLYLGKKAVSRLGCYACHAIPGFDSAKPIGVGLNDWGKKDPERLAFEDIENFLRGHFRPVEGRTEGGKPQPFVVDGGKEYPPYEEFYWDKLSHHHRDRMGYLNQKLLDPRSYDYGRLRSADGKTALKAWDDFSRMPQFRFVRARRHAGENDKDFQARMWMEEAEAREAVMTFILGLVAEPVPTRMINQPKGDRLAEVKGRQILDKYNCAGCHLVRPGTYDFRASPDVLKELEEKHAKVEKAIREGAYDFPDHNHWAAPYPPAPDRIVAHSIRPLFDPEEKIVSVRLSEALRYKAPDGSPRDIPSSRDLFFPIADLVSDPGSIKSQEDLDRQLAAQAPYGGTFSDLMQPYLMQKNPALYNPAGKKLGEESGNARVSLPPSLLGQGERTQPDWLYRFLLNPQPVRRMTVLRMPRFNMSPDEARALVDYFAAVERITNPAAGLSYPLDVIPQQGELDSPYWSGQNRDYRQRIEEDKGDKTSLASRQASYRKVFEQVREEQAPLLKKNLEKLKDQIASQTKERDRKKKDLEDAKGDKKTALEKEVADLDGPLTAAREQVKGLETQLQQLSVEDQEKAWKGSEIYATEAWRLVNNRQLCLQCHQIGEERASNPQTQGPPLHLANQRLRPDWTYRWIASPMHFNPYDAPPMPQYFAATSKNLYPTLFVGSGPDMVRAARDVLMNYPRISALPGNRLYRPEDAKAEEKK